MGPLGCYFLGRLSLRLLPTLAGLLSSSFARPSWPFACEKSFWEGYLHAQVLPRNWSGAGKELPRSWPRVSLRARPKTQTKPIARTGHKQIREQCKEYKSKLNPRGGQERSRDPERAWGTTPKSAVHPGGGSLRARQLRSHGLLGVAAPRWHASVHQGTGLKGE